MVSTSSVTIFLFVWLQCSSIIQGFVAPSSSIVGRSAVVPEQIQEETALFMGKKRNAQKRQRVEKQSRSRPEQFFEAVEDAAGKTKEKPLGDDSDTPEDELRRQRAAESQARMDERPDVSTMAVDEETGIEIIQQGKAVMDVVTRKAVKLSDLGDDYRLAQMFPGVPPNLRDEHRFQDWSKIEVPHMVSKLVDACSVTNDDGKIGIPTHPNVSNKAIDFVTANRDYLGRKMKKALGRLTMRSMSEGKQDEAREYQKLWKHFLLLENHISAPFRQIVMDAEGRMGPNFGNLDLMSYANGSLYQRAGNYLVLKSMVANWEKKVRDAEYYEKTPQTKENFVSVLSRGDPKRYLPDPPILFTLRECTQVCLMSQQLCKAFVETPALYDDLPPEIRFLEQSLNIKGGTALRQYMIEDFCPKEQITPEGLREGMRRLYQQLENMQLDPYGDIANIIARLISAMSVGTDDERDPYLPYLGNVDQDGPGYFQTYTFNHEKLSLVRFLDMGYDKNRGQSSGSANKKPSSQSDNPLGNLFNFGGDSKNNDDDDFDPMDGMDDEEEDYAVPPARAAGRPHELGWLDMFDAEKQASLPFGKVPVGKIIPNDE